MLLVIIVNSFSLDKYFLINQKKNTIINKNNFVFFRYWCQDSEEKLSEIIANLLTSKYPSSSPNKRKRPPKNSSAQNSLPTSDQVIFFFFYKSKTKLIFALLSLAFKSFRTFSKKLSPWEWNRNRSLRTGFNAKSSSTIIFS